MPVSKVDVADLSGNGCSLVLGSDYWNDYILGFDTLDFLNGGPAGALFLVRRQDTTGPAPSPEADRHFIPLPGLNTVADEQHPDISDDGQTIVFHAFGEYGEDIFVYRMGQGILELPGLNAEGVSATYPSVSGDGRLVAFVSRLERESPDIALYDTETRSFIDLPGVNTSRIESRPVLSSDGTMLAYSRRNGNDTDMHLYDIANKTHVDVIGTWFNTDEREHPRSLGSGGRLLAFEGVNRVDGQGGQDIYLFDRSRSRLRKIDGLNSRHTEGEPDISPEGSFLAYYSNRNEPDMFHLGWDIFLMDLESGEQIFLPSLNSGFQDGAPAISQNAEYILFHSKRPGGKGGYDIYLYKRDMEDETEYTVTEAYAEDGSVTYENGRAAANTEVRALDGNGEVIASALTDESGSFAVTIPVGSLLPVRYESDAENAKVITDEVGDDTYVPDFEAGNLKFTDVWVEDVMQAGFPAKIWFDVETETPKHNTYVRIYLVSLPTGSVDDLDVSKGSFIPDYTLTGLFIDKLGHSGPGDPVTNTQGQDIATEITYLADDNSKAHVEHSFVIPNHVEDGTYAAVFSIGRFDYNPEDDALQSEDTGDADDNFMAAPASVIIGQPDKPNLRILSAKLNTSSFELPDNRPSGASAGSTSELVLNMEVESMAQDTTLPVDIAFSLEVDGQIFPISYRDANESGYPVKRDKKTYQVSCVPETRPGFPDGERCASLFRQDQQGFTYSLYIDGDAYDALSSKTSDAVCRLVIQLDPEETVDEWENNTADNVKKMPVMFLASQAKGRRQARRATSKVVFDEGADQEYGNSDFGVSYNFGAALSYEESTLNGTTYPSAAHFDAGDNGLLVTIFGNAVVILNVGADFKYDVDHLTDTNYTSFYWGLTVMNETVFGLDGAVGLGADSDDTLSVQEVWNTQDDDGNERFAVNKSIEYSATFMAGPVPITVRGGGCRRAGNPRQCQCRLVQQNNDIRGALCIFERVCRRFCGRFRV